MPGFRHVHLSHDNAPSHANALVKQFSKSENFTVFPHQPCSPDLAICDFFFSNLQMFLFNRRYKSRKALCLAISQCFRVYLNHRTIWDFKNGFRDYYTFQTADNTWKGCKVYFTSWVKCFWDIAQYTLHIDQPLYISLKYDHL